MALTLLILAATAVATSFLSGILGMAGGMILMGILLAMMPVANAMLLHGITQLASNGWRALLWRQHVRWPTVWGYVMGAAIALAVFGIFQLVLSRPWVYIALGITPFITLLLPPELKLNVDKRGHPLACGLVCMAMQLLSGVSGPLLDTFFIASRMDRKSVIATKAAAQTLSHLAKIGYFGVLLVSSAGTVEPAVALMMVVCAALGTSASRRLLEKMSDADFRTWTRRVILAIGSFYLASGVWALGFA